MYNITITPKAIKSIKYRKLKFNLPDHFLRVSVKGGGCNGFIIDIDFDNHLSKTDIAFQLGDEKVVIDNKSIKYLDNSEIDWKNSLLEEKFIVNSERIISSCGCGKSSSIK